MNFSLLLQAFLSLLFVIGLVFLVFWLMKFCESKGLRNPLLRKLNVSNRLSVIESKRLDNHNYLLLARCDDDEYLFLIGNNQNLILRAAKGEQKK